MEINATQPNLDDGQTSLLPGQAIASTERGQPERAQTNQWLDLPIASQTHGHVGQKPVQYMVRPAHVRSVLLLAKFFERKANGYFRP
jgi:hypothetical protein